MNHTLNQEAGEPTRTQDAVEQLLGLIRDEGLAAGDALPTEAELVARLGISRSIVREALSFLKGLGLIISRRGSAFRVAEADPVAAFALLMRHMMPGPNVDLDEFLQLRAILETGAVASAVEAATEEDILAVGELADRLEAIGQPGCTNAEYNLLDAEFHLAITRPARCRMLLLLNEAIRAFFHRQEGEKGGAPVPDDELQRSNLQHRQIASAFALRQPEVAAACLRDHLH